jgi:hypothetical protein
MLAAERPGGLTGRPFLPLHARPPSSPPSPLQGEIIIHMIIMITTDSATLRHHQQHDPLLVTP